ncbi:hypothetical protein ACFL3S_02480 [Gemmatimonadota bacterium]
MDELFSPDRRGPESGVEPTVNLDPILDLRVERRPWEVRAAQWRAWHLAEMIFGPEVRVRLAGRGGPSTFRGLLTLGVPFSDLADHRAREALFMSWVARDPLLARVPFIYVFEASTVQPGIQEQ